VQWARFLTANLSGFIINRGIYALLVTFVAVAALEPVIAVFAGAVAGMMLNFNLSRKLVFR
jgi:putative flippase GtrA